jgi:hypothetical protein
LTTEFGPLTTEFGPSAAECGPWAAECGREFTEFSLGASGFGPLLCYRNICCTYLVPLTIRGGTLLVLPRPELALRGRELPWSGLARAINEA